MPMTNAERQAAWRARQRETHKRTNTVFCCTDDEAFYLRRVLEQMRREKSVPAMMRRPNGTMSPLDA